MGALDDREATGADRAGIGLGQFGRGNGVDGNRGNGPNGVCRKDVVGYVEEEAE
jgi:hypothetical protein